MSYRGPGISSPINSYPVYDKGGQTWNIKAFGAIGNGIQAFDGVVAATSSSFSSASAAFVSTDAGKIIVIWGAGASAEALVTTIVGVVSATTVTLGTAATTAVAAATWVYGNDDSAAILAAIDACVAGSPGGGTVEIPAGIYLCNSVVSPQQSSGHLVLAGAGKGASVLMGDAFGVNEVIQFRMPATIRDLTVDANNVTINGMILSAGMVGATATGNVASTTAGSGVVTLAGNFPVAVGDVMSVFGAGPVVGSGTNTQSLTGTVTAVTVGASTSVTLNVLATTTVAAKKAFFGSALSPVGEYTVENFNVRNVASNSPGYGLQVVDPNGSYPPQIGTLRLLGVTAGPSYSTLQEVVNILNVHDCFVKSMVCEGITGRVGPNFFGIDNLVVEGLILDLSTAAVNDILVFGADFGSAGNYIVDGLVVNDPHGVGKPIIVYCSELQASNWNIPYGGLCYIHFNTEPAISSGTFTNCVLGSGIGVMTSPATLTITGGRVGLNSAAPRACINNPNSGNTGLITASGVTFDLTGTVSNVVLSSTSATVVAQVQFSNCSVINSTAAVKVINQGSVTGSILGCAGLNPFGMLTAPVVGASPWTYTNTNAFAVVAYVSDSAGGTTIAVGGTTVLTVLAGGSGSVRLGAGEAMVVTYTTTPTVQVVGE